LWKNSFEMLADEESRVAPFVRFLKHRLLKHQLRKHRLFDLKHRLIKKSTGKNID
jgi:hypothetical protein